MYDRSRKSSALSGVLLVGMVLVYGELFLSGILRQQLGDPAGAIVYDAALALIAIAIVGFMGVWREIGFRRPEHWRSLWWFSPLVLFGIVSVLSSHLHVYAGFGDTAIFSLLYLVQSIQSRLIFEGLMVRSLLPVGRWPAAVLPGLVQALLIAVEFALVPPENGFVPILLLTAASTAASGFVYAALRLRTGLLWPLIVTDVVTGIAYILALPPNASPYPLTTVRLVRYSADIAFGLVFGSIALLSMRRRESRAVVARHGMIEGTQATAATSRPWAISCLALFVGVTVLVGSFGAYIVAGMGGPPKYQGGSQHSYFAARLGTDCDTGAGHWSDDDPEDRYTCRPDGLQITQLKFDYDGEAYFEFAGEDESSVPFHSHDYWVGVDARIVGGQPGTCVELAVHLQDFQGRQWFSACNDGSWTIGRCDLHCDNDTTLLSGELAKGSDQYALQVHVTDSVMTFVINGKQVTVLHDNTYTSTDQLVVDINGPSDLNNLPSAIFSDFSYTPID